MPAAIIILLRIAFMTLSIFGILKVFSWIFNINSDDDDNNRDDISWLEAAKARPSLLLRPFITILILLFIIASIYWLATSTTNTAVSIRNLFAYIWPLLKWVFIIASVVGVNWFLILLFFHDFWSEIIGNVRDKKPFGTILEDSLTGGIANPLLSMSILVPINILFTIGIYYQLPESLQQQISELILETKKSAPSQMEDTKQ